MKCERVLSFELSKHLENLRRENNLSFSCKQMEEKFLSGELNNFAASYLQKRKEPIIWGAFDCSYYPSLNSEFAIIQEVSPSVEKVDLSDFTKCCVLINGTKGISEDEVVAIFPENLKNHIPCVDDKVFYFADKFAHRHLNFTRSFIQEFEYKKFFEELLYLEKKDLLGIVSSWVHLHEEGHRTGNFPLPNFLKQKSNLFLAALEELRADVYAIIRLLNIESEDAIITAKYILAERLLGYHLFRGVKNFDTISSVLLWRLLLKYDFFSNPHIETLHLSLIKIQNDIQGNENYIYKEKQNKDLRFAANYLFDGNYEASYDQYLKFWRKK